MPGKLTIEHELPFAILGDTQMEAINRFREEGKDFVIECFIPKQEEYREFFGRNTFIAQVREIDNERSTIGDVSQQTPEGSSVSDLGKPAEPQQ